MVVMEDSLGLRVGLPAQVGPCRLVRLLGQGAMAWVWEAQIENQVQPVAVKILMPHAADDQTALQRFRREMNILQELRHPRLVRWLGHGDWTNVPYILLPLLSGGSLKDLIAHNRRYGAICDFQRAFRWFVQVLEGLEVLHAAGLVHRDLKPSNILLDAQRDAVVADLGIAKRVNRETASLTATGMAVGTYHYMAPEQWESPESVDGRRICMPWQLPFMSY